MDLLCKLCVLLTVCGLAPARNIHTFTDDVAGNARNVPGVRVNRPKRQADGEHCGRVFTGARRGTVFIPFEVVNNTKFYAKNANCEWKILAPEGRHVVLTSDRDSAYFQLEESDDCVWDYVEIDDGGDPVRFCGDRNVSFVSAGNNVNIRFKSDESMEDKGFKFVFETIDSASVDDSSCNGRIFGGDGGHISSRGYPEPYTAYHNCFYRIEAPVGQVIEFTVTDVDFGNRTCDEEGVWIYDGVSTRDLLGKVCNDTANGLLPYRTTQAFVYFKAKWPTPGKGFRIEYSFADDIFTTPPTPWTTPSPVGGNADCSRFYMDESEITYVSPADERYKHCIVVIRNTMMRGHVIQVEFPAFDVENSTNCAWDSLKVFSGERNSSSRIGTYCGTELAGRTLVSNGNSMRLEYTTDESYTLSGFTAKISIVPPRECQCRDGFVCARKPNEKLCIKGSVCEDNSCQNGGTCVVANGVHTCVCPPRFSGPACEQLEGGGKILHFTRPPSDKLIQKGNTHYEECQVDDPEAEYSWLFNDGVIDEQSSSEGLTDHGKGVLEISSFNEDFVGWYTCVAETATSSAEYTFYLQMPERCDVRITSAPGQNQVRVGNSVAIPCGTRGARNVTWWKDNHIIYLNDHPRFRKLANNYLLINNVELADAGKYECQAESHSGCLIRRAGELTVVDVKETSKVCGRTVDQSSGRISRGSDVKQGESPWHVLLVSNVHGKSRDSFCGGTLISQNWVLTAAHCIDSFERHKKYGEVPFSEQSVRLVFGSVECYNRTSTVSRAPRRIIKHPRFNQATQYDNDIALIELDSPLEYTANIVPVCLEPSTFNDAFFFKKRLTASMAKVIGCGKLSGRRRAGRSNILQKVEVPYVAWSTCNASVATIAAGSEKARHMRMTESMICAGYSRANMGDACGGDSGGSLAMADEDRWVQVGIVSWGFGCDRKGTYGYYTNVGLFFEWIRRITAFDEEQVDAF